ncbi:DUF2254 domain-containing protein [Alteromonas lipolytica]|uniref:DUF2254 domain-containing protein n=1 Tax=Alteromonas lipolytica TaxID=1856405 RepID=A0A1E8FCT5_9ALTE|nr:DUF2254 domain-containing protein [Alteromonas lipolytica]OFI33742.1 hypothetical protein BFC17_19390 [Alteromonas lipolytica]GGF68808.1 hypothetical protein GCM10011338_21270 [Alteromonas lipolytica]
MTLRLIITRVRVLWESLSTSYWFIPVLMMSIGVALCYLCLAVIGRAMLPDWLRPLIPLVTQNNVQQLLSTVAGAMITVTSIAFSMTLVSLTLASNQFGPRLIRNFMHDRNTQWVLGLLVTTFLFCLISLHHLSSISSNQDAISVLAGVTVFLALIDCVTIIFFIHHVSRSIQADQVIADCVFQFENNLDSLLPLPENHSAYQAIAEQWTSPESSFRVNVYATTSGYIQTINYASFLSQPAAQIAGTEVFVRSGDHVLCGEPLFSACCHQPLNEEDFATLRQAIVFGANRTPIQDPEFAITQLVEIALRALSPGINDPHTAITCVDKLTALCVKVSTREFPAQPLVNTTTEVWLKRRTFTFAGIIDKAYSQIIQAAVGQSAVLRHLLFNLGKLHEKCEHSVRAAITQHAKSIYILKEQMSLSEADERKLEEAYQPFKNSLI